MGTKGDWFVSKRKKKNGSGSGKRNEADAAPATVATDVPAFYNDIEFDTKFRGYDRDQVDDYIAKLTVDYNAICEKNAALVRENEGLRRVFTAIQQLRAESRPSQ